MFIAKSFALLLIFWIPPAIAVWFRVYVMPVESWPGRAEVIVTMIGFYIGMWMFLFARWEDTKGPLRWIARIMATPWPRK